MFMVFNYLNQPSLLEATPTGEFWSSRPGPSTEQFTGDSTEHFSQTILVTDPAYSELFQATGLDRLPNLHHVTFAISTRILDRPEGRAHEFLLNTTLYDADWKELPELQSNDGYTGDVFFDVGGWPHTPLRPELLPVLKDIFGDWKCVVEYFKSQAIYAMYPEERSSHPLFHMGILGDGEHLRRAEMRMAGTMTMGVINGDYVHKDDRVWQEFYDGGWHDI